MFSNRLPQQLYHLDRTSSTFHDQVSEILYGEEYNQWIPTVQDDDLVMVVDILDKVRFHVSHLRSPLKPPQTLDSLDPASPAFRKCLRELRHTCGARTVLPPSHTLSSETLTVGRRPIASGGSGDVYEGFLGDSKVCVKRIRIYSKDGPEEVTKVHNSLHFLLAVTYETYRCSTKRLWCGNTYNIRTSSLSLASLHPPLSLSRSGCPTGT